MREYIIAVPEKAFTVQFRNFLFFDRPKGAIIMIYMISFRLLLIVSAVVSASFALDQAGDNQRMGSGLAVGSLVVFYHLSLSPRGSYTFWVSFFERWPRGTVLGWITHIRAKSMLTAYHQMKCKARDNGLLALLNLAHDRYNELEGHLYDYPPVESRPEPKKLVRMPDRAAVEPATTSAVA